MQTSPPELTGAWPNPHPYAKYLYLLGKGRGQAQFVLCLFLAERSQDLKFCGQVRKRAEYS